MNNSDIYLYERKLHKYEVDNTFFFDFENGMNVKRGKFGSISRIKISLIAFVFS